MIAVPPRSRGVTVLVVLQSALACCYYVGAGGLYLLVSAKNGWPGWLGPDHDPKGYWPAFLWPLYLPVAVSVGAGLVFAPVLAIVGGANLVRPSVRANRRLFWTLAATTLLCAGMVVLIMTPLGQHLQAWMLD